MNPYIYIWEGFSNWQTSISDERLKRPALSRSPKMPGGKLRADPITVALITRRACVLHFFRWDALQEPEW